MAYQNDIPQANDELATSQDDLLNNFAAIDTFVNVNHVGFNGADQGKHAQITFPLGPLAGQPFTYAVGEIGLQSLNQLPTSVPDIWMSRGASTAFPITGAAISNPGWSYLPSGVLLKWGTVAVPSGGSYAIVFPVAATNPVYANAIVAFLTNYTNMTSYVVSLTTTTLTINTSGAGTVGYLVIGA